MKIDLTFQEISAALRRVAAPPVDMVVGVGRGGIVPASLLAFRLGTGLAIVEINYRDDDNRPRHAAPRVLSAPPLPDGVRSILLVDDVSVSGQTLEAAKALFDDYDVTTLVLKGRADIVVFPDIAACVNWPWKARVP